MITRGKRNFVRRFIENLEGVFLPYTFNGKPASLQLVPRPVQIWEVAFPEPCKDQVLSMLGNDVISTLSDDQLVHTENTWIQKIVAWVAGKFGLEAIPKEINRVAPQVQRDNVAVHLVGLKKDKVVPVVNEAI